MSVNQQKNASSSSTCVPRRASEIVQFVKAKSEKKM